VPLVRLRRNAVSGNRLRIIAILRKGGRFVLCGLFGGAANVSTAVIAIRELSILGSVVGNTSDLAELVDMVKHGKIELPDVECRPLETVNASLEDLAAGRVVGRVVLEVQ
jgi:D-arabinose 1-dehydrogenase-like Zn-dependent alcohol dehydrogenase